MPPTSRTRLSARLVQVRAAMNAASLDALIVSHLPNVTYLTNFSGSAAVLVVEQSRCQFVTDSRYAVAVAAQLESDVGCPETSLVVVERSYDETLAAVVRDLRAVRVGFEAAHLSFRQHEVLARALPGPDPSPVAGTGSAAAGPILVPTDRIVERLRAVKDAGEIETLRLAARRLSEAARRVLRAIRPGPTEREIAAEIDRTVREAGFDRPAFDTIVASGLNSALPHARPGARRVEAGDLVMLDFGGVYDGYCVDLTRTVCIGAPDPRHRRLHAAVADAQLAAIDATRPGALASEVDAAARRTLEARGLGEAFVHGTGHGLGLEVHEEPRLGRRDPDRHRAVASGADGPLVAGMVFTVEPGAYQRALGGVRLEDDILVTDGGCDVLTDVPRDLWLR